MTGPVREFPAPPAEFVELLHTAVLGAPAPWRPYMDPRSYLAASREHADRWAQLLWEQAWTAGARWGMGRAPARIVVPDGELPEVGGAT